MCKEACTDSIKMLTVHFFLQDLWINVTSKYFIFVLVHKYWCFLKHWRHENEQNEDNKQLMYRHVNSEGWSFWVFRVWRARQCNHQGIKGDQQGLDRNLAWSYKCHQSGQQQTDNWLSQISGAMDRLWYYSCSVLSMACYCPLPPCTNRGYKNTPTRQDPLNIFCQHVPHL